jgi:hypothetical protein
LGVEQRVQSLWGSLLFGGQQFSGFNNFEGKKCLGVKKIGSDLKEKKITVQVRLFEIIVRAQLQLKTKFGAICISHKIKYGG